MLSVGDLSRLQQGGLLLLLAQLVVAAAALSGTLCADMLFIASIECCGCPEVQLVRWLVPCSLPGS